MKRIFLLVAIIATLCLTGCGSQSDKQIKNDFIKDIEGLKSYYMEGTLKLTNNDDTYEYNVEVNYKKDDKYKVSLKNKANDYEQIILKNDDGVYVITPSLNKSFKFQSDWPNNNSQSYLLSSVANDLKNDSAYKFTQKDKDYIFTTKTNYPNNPKYVKQNIILDKNGKLKKVEVKDENDTTYIEYNVKTIDKKATFNDEQFSLDEVTKEFSNENEAKQEEDKDTDSAMNDEEIAEENSESQEQTEIENNSNQSQNITQNQSSDNENATQSQNSTQNQESTNNTDETSKIDENIFPLYLPSNTSLSDKEVIDTANGQRVIMTFSGDSPFILVEETIKPSTTLEVIPTYGEPFMLIDTVGSLTDTSYTWTSNGVEYYIVSEQIDQDELLEIAKSINVVSTINEK